MNNRICYIVGAGENYGIDFIPSQDSFVIAADGGLRYLEQANIGADLVIGDFDSLGAPPSGGAETIILPSEKDDTDMAAAIREGWRRGFRHFHIYGGTGGRLDHTIANIQCIADIANCGGRGFLIDKDSIITAISNDGVRFPAGAKGTVSAICHSDTAVGVNETGLKYPLTDAALRNTYPLGVSNEFTGVPSEISVRIGTLIIIYPKSVQEESN